MADNYRIIGAEMSPYSVKVRSYFRYKAIPHQWVLRSAASQAEFEQRSGDVLNMIAHGELKLKIYKVYPLAEAAQAHRDLEGRKTTGKLVIGVQ